MKPNTDLFDKFTFIFLRIVKGDLNLEITDKLVSILKTEFITPPVLVSYQNKTVDDDKFTSGRKQGVNYRQLRDKENDPNYNNKNNGEPTSNKNSSQHLVIFNYNNYAKRKGNFRVFNHENPEKTLIYPQNYRKKFS